MPSQAETIEALRKQSAGTGVDPVTQPQSPADQAPFGNAMAQAVGLPDAVRALKGQMTPEEAQSFAMTAALGLIPGAGKVEGVATKTMGELLPHMFAGNPSASKMIPAEYMGMLGGEKAFSKQYPNLYKTIQGQLEAPAAGAASDISDEAISKKLADNPGASIFDVAGMNVGGPSSPLSKKPSIGEPNPQIDIKNLTPEENKARLQRMQQDYPSRLYHGVKPYQQFYGPGVQNNQELYMAENPQLADMYAGVNPGDKLAEGYTTPGSVVPVQADLSKFHVFDAKGTPTSSGELWAQVNNEAKHQARDLGAPGVTIKNVFDEPASTKHLGEPQTIHILLDKDWNNSNEKFPLRSPFAMFDPNQYHANNLLAGLAGGAVATPAVTPMVQDYIKALQGGQDQSQ
jgi:hypothetical protein